MSWPYFEKYIHVTLESTYFALGSDVIMYLSIVFISYPIFLPIQSYSQRQPILAHSICRPSGGKLHISIEYAPTFVGLSSPLNNV